MRVLRRVSAVCSGHVLVVELVAYERAFRPTHPLTMFRRLSSARDAARRSREEHREDQLRENSAAPKAVVELPLYRE